MGINNSNFIMSGDKNISEVTSQVVAMAAFHDYNIKYAYEKYLSDDLKSKYSFEEVKKYYMSKIARSEFIEEV